MFITMSEIRKTTEEERDKKDEDQMIEAAFTIFAYVLMACIALVFFWTLFGNFPF